MEHMVCMYPISLSFSLGATCGFSQGPRRILCAQMDNLLRSDMWWQHRAWLKPPKWVMSHKNTTTTTTTRSLVQLSIHLFQKMKKNHYFLYNPTLNRWYKSSFLSCGLQEIAALGPYTSVQVWLPSTTFLHMKHLASHQDNLSQSLVT